MSEIYSQPLVVGIDAGGTRSRVCLAEAAPGGAVLGRGSGGPGNALSVGRAELTAHLTAALARAVPPAARARVAAVHGGFAGAAPGLGPERGRDLALSCLADALAATGIAPGALDVGGDTEVALAAAPGAPADGLVLIAGTGAIAERIAGRRRTAVVDGHGWLLGDDGSGFWLGHHAARAALAALDGRGPATSLLARVLEHYFPAGELPGRPVPGREPLEQRRPEPYLPEPRPPGPYLLERLPPEPYLTEPHLTERRRTERPPAAEALPGQPSSRRPSPPVAAVSRAAAAHEVGEALVVAVYGRPAVELALLSPLVVAAAGEGDAVAAGLLDEAAALLARSVRALAPRAGEPLVVTGGLLGPGGPLLGRVGALLADHGLDVFPVADGTAGAVALARALRS